eukprot:357044-Chlamydomonas_euryale.AAC.2
MDEEGGGGESEDHTLAYASNQVALASQCTTPLLHQWLQSAPTSSFTNDFTEHHPAPSPMASKCTDKFLH